MIFIMIAFLGTGIDLMEIDEFRNQYDLDLESELFSDRERASMPRSIESIAARFCAKEAFVKAVSPLGIGKDWHDFEVVSDESGAVHFRLSEKITKVLKKFGKVHVSLSLTHTQATAGASVVLLLTAA